jgi:hypothetical protein
MGAAGYWFMRIPTHPAEVQDFPEESAVDKTGEVWDFLHR